MWRKPHKDTSVGRVTISSNQHEATNLTFVTTEIMRELTTPMGCDPVSWCA